MVRGYYPSYVYRLWHENNCNIKIEDGDLEIIRKYTSEFLAVSYYKTTTHEAGQKFFGDTGGDIGTPNPFLKTSDWGWQVEFEWYMNVINTNGREL